MNDSTTCDLRHFLRLARRGKQPRASEGECQAAALATAVLQHAPGLDSQATAGLVVFLHGVQAAPDTAGELLAGGEGDGK